jgi:C-terminal processing protease CtpA/Prc
MRSIASLRSAVLLLLLLAGATSAGERGYFGFGLAISGKGFFLNPEVTALKIASIAPGMPAARAGIQAGDQITRVDGLSVVGSKAMTLKSHAEREVGQSLRLELKHANGQVYTVNMVAVPKP